ncbi:MAG: DJ-1/PfpI family protein [Candidatus Aenigmatarchaeota archaeon]
MSNLEGKRVLMIIAPNNFRDEELLKPKEILEKARAEVKVASKGVKEARGMMGSIVSVDLDISEAEVQNYDAIIFVGGTGAEIYFNDSTALGIVRKAYEQGKVIGAICIAPSILANAGILEGKKATSWPSETSNLEANGVRYTGESVTVDGKIITAKGPEAASQFGKAIAEALS